MVGALFDLVHAHSSGTGLGYVPCLLQLQRFVEQAWAKSVSQTGTHAIRTFACLRCCITGDTIGRAPDNFMGGSAGCSGGVLAANLVVPTNVVGNNSPARRNKRMDRNLRMCQPTRFIWRAVRTSFMASRARLPGHVLSSPSSGLCFPAVGVRFLQSSSPPVPSFSFSSSSFTSLPLPQHVYRDLHERPRSPYLLFSRLLLSTHGRLRVSPRTTRPGACATTSAGTSQRLATTFGELSFPTAGTSTTGHHRRGSKWHADERRRRCQCATA